MTARWRAAAAVIAIAAFTGLTACEADSPAGTSRQQSGLPNDIAAPPGATNAVNGGAAGMGGSMGSTGDVSAGTTATPMGSDPVTGGSDQAITPGDPGVRVFDAGNDPDRNNVVAGDVCTRLAQIQCAGEAYCCDNPGRDRTACEAAMRSGCVSELYLDAMTRNPITGFQAETAATVFTEIEHMASTCDASIAAFGASRNGLMGMFQGSIDSGSSCSPGLAAASDMSRAAASLASCADIGSVACLPKSTLSWSCQPRGQVGDPCFTDLNCVDGLYCPNPNFDIGETDCAERKGIGSACSLPTECESLFCKGGTCVEASAQAAYCLAD